MWRDKLGENDNPVVARQQKRKQALRLVTMTKRGSLDMATGTTVCAHVTG